MLLLAKEAGQFCMHQLLWGVSFGLFLEKQVVKWYKYVFLFLFYFSLFNLRINVFVMKLSSG